MKHTLASVKSNLDQIVKHRGPNYVYHGPEGDHGGCVYRFLGKPSCGVGVWFDMHGIKLNPSHNRAAMSQKILPEDVQMTPGAYELLARFQMEQDAGVPYGQALAEAYRQVLDLFPQPGTAVTS